ncbi:protein YpfM, partial [Escherichia coli]|nr:protein YpfM [Salmonella enterica]EFM3753634.1 protein YpfM [Escherichia coli]EIC2385702.1 protein YpfM [Salmonella enterica subsp. enterica serovar Okatie]EIG8795474.1 protein YpfM [Escherichia coli]EIU8335770.1 protein YpfM [Escherichia coli]
MIERELGNWKDFI